MSFEDLDTSANGGLQTHPPKKRGAGDRASEGEHRKRKELIKEHSRDSQSSQDATKR